MIRNSFCAYPKAIMKNQTWKMAAGKGRIVLLACCILLPSSFCLQALGQSYSIGWYKIAGGGGISTNGQYSITGTIGQPDAGPAMTGGGYSVTGGFWSLIAVQMPGAPLLSIAASGNQVIVSWPASSSGYTLQTNSSLNPANWGGYSGAVNNNSAAISPPRGNVFFRLYHP